MDDIYKDAIRNILIKYLDNEETAEEAATEIIEELDGMWAFGSPPDPKEGLTN